MPGALSIASKRGGVAGISPALEQMSHVAIRGKLVADAVRIDILHTRRHVSGEHNITRLQYLPYDSGIGVLALPVYKSAGNPGFARQAFGLAKDRSGRHIVEIGINDLKRLRSTFRLALPQVEEDDGTVVRFADSRFNHLHIQWFAGSEHGEH